MDEGLITEANDGRKVGEAGVADALGDGDAGDGDTGEEIEPELGKRVPGRPFEYGNKILEVAPRHRARRLALEIAEGIVRQERLFQAVPERREERPPAGKVHLVTLHIQRSHDGKSMIPDPISETPLGRTG